MKRLIRVVVLISVIVPLAWAQSDQHQHGHPPAQQEQQPNGMQDMQNMPGMNMSQPESHVENMELGFTSGTSWQAQSAPDTSSS